MAFFLKKRTNKQTEILNRADKVLNLLIYRAPPTVHFHRIAHSFQRGEVISRDHFLLKVSKELRFFAICLPIFTLENRSLKIVLTVF